MSLMLWIITRHPKDYPDSFVARQWAGDTPTTEHIVAPDLGTLRKEMHRRGLVCIARDESDDPVVVETWL